PDVPPDLLPHAIAAVALRPDSHAAWLVLGNADWVLGDTAQAIQAFRKALELDPADFAARENLGQVLADSGQVSAGIAELENAAQEDRSGLAWCNIGIIRGRSGDVSGALTAFREAVRQDPAPSTYHEELSAYIEESGDVDGALVEARDAVRRDPAWSDAHARLACVLERSRDPEALDEFAEAIRLSPDDGETHRLFAFALEQAGRFEEALRELDRAQELGELRPSDRYAENRSEWQRILSDQDRLGAILRGEAVPRDARESKDAAGLCNDRGLFARAAALYAEAFAGDASLAAELEFGRSPYSNRFAAADCAALAVAGLGKDAGTLTAEARHDLARRALDWLRDDLEQFAQALSVASPEERELLA